METLTQTQLEQAQKEYIGLIIDGKVSLSHSCIEVQSYQLVSDSQWTTQAPTYHYEWVTVGTYCSWSDAGGGGGGGGGADSGNGGTTNNGGSSGTGPHGGNGSGGGGSGSGGSSGGYNPSGNSGGILTAVIDNDLSTNFFANLALSAEQDAWLDNHFSLRLEIINYLENNHTQEDYEEIKDMIDIMDDGMVDGEPVLVGPNEPIDDMEEYLSCFNTSLGATITIYADQPKTGGHNVWTYYNSVGHAFITIQQGDNIASFGFYPQCSPCSLAPNNLTPNPFDFFSTPGVFGNDQGHDYDVSLSIPISSTGLASLINGTISIAENSPMYNIGSLNCTDIAIIILEGNTSVNIPSCESPGLWQGQTSGTLGEIIRNMTTPAGGIKNTTGGNAPNNNCN